MEREITEPNPSPEPVAQEAPAPLIPGYRLWFTLGIQPDRRLYPKRLIPARLKFWGKKEKQTLELTCVSGENLAEVEKHMTELLKRYFQKAKLEEEKAKAI
jgi:hypothetical protein